MKEIGMEKLVELLNEYEETLHTGLHWKIDERYGMLWRGLNLMGVEQFLISKHYGFIEWLVDNDKIDKKKLDEVERKPMYVTDDMFSLYKVDECVIMLLSISDTPIEDLISYLK